MKRAVLTLLAPPWAACRFGCGGCCAAPVTVFWIAALVSLGYGLVGGPAKLMGTSWDMLFLGLALWGIASVWTALTIRGADDDRCVRANNDLCRRRAPEADESDPFEEIRKAR